MPLRSKRIIRTTHHLAVYNHRSGAAPVQIDCIHRPEETHNLANLAYTRTNTA